MTRSLWEPVTLGAIEASNRLAMAPMTRNRAATDGTPTELTALYYAQRADLGLLITEGTQPSADGQGYPLTPGIHTPEQVAAWRGVADAVHAAGGRLVIQLMHAGRIGHPSNTAHGRVPVGPSEVAADGRIFTLSGMHPLPVPRALTTDEIQTTVDDFRRAAALALEAGVDGVEVHGANGYLIHQFLSANANRRTDAYGGSVANRIRFAVETAAAVVGEIGADRTGFRISPLNTHNDIAEPDAHEVYGALVPELAALDLAFLHLRHGGDDELTAAVRRDWPGALVLNRPGAPLADRVADVESGLADMTAIGIASLANPDLADRLRTGADLNTPDKASFYGGTERGYTDYPTLAQLAAAV